jgi:hypothetical protein
MKNANKLRLYSTEQHEANSDLTIEVYRHVYNMALDDSKITYETKGIPRSYKNQAAMLTTKKKANPNLKAVLPGLAGGY